MSQKVMSKKKQATARRIIDALHESHGLICSAAAMAGVDRRTVHRYMKEFPQVAEAVEEAREKLYDAVESRLFEKIEAGDLTAIIFFLKTRCRHRGYIERQEVDMPKDITLRVVYDEPCNSMSISDG
jgi:hypothetical protein